MWKFFFDAPLNSRCPLALDEGTCTSINIGAVRKRTNALIKDIGVLIN